MHLESLLLQQIRPRSWPKLPSLYHHQLSPLPLHLPCNSDHLYHSRHTPSRSHLLLPVAVSGSLCATANPMGTTTRTAATVITARTSSRWVPGGGSDTVAYPHRLLRQPKTKRPKNSSPVRDGTSGPRVHGGSVWTDSSRPVGRREQSLCPTRIGRRSPPFITDRSSQTALQRGR